MKTTIRFMQVILVILAVVCFYSCEKKDNETGLGTAEFSISLSDEISQNKSGTALDSGIVSFQILISVEDMEGNPALTDELIPLYIFGSGYVSESVVIRNGEYRLTKFMVIDPSGVVVYASPLAGSPLAYLTNKPLPLIFSIYPDRTTRIIPEVLAVGNHPPDQFGYASFGMHIIKPLHFWAICILDNPLIMAPTQLTRAKLTVYASNDWHYTFKLEAAINHLIIRGGSDIYYFVLEKEGYPPQRMKFSARELMYTSKDSPLVLKIPWGSNQYKVLVLQPGPEDGKDAMVSNLEPDRNFGAHKYFEATFLSEPILTVMRSNRSLIRFNMDELPDSAIIKQVALRLSYDLPIPWDSTIITNSSTGFAWYGGVLQQITEPWEEEKVTWNSLPETTESNQVFMNPFISNINFIDVDVTRLFVPEAEIAAPDYGMLFKLYPSEGFPGFRFASSDFPEPIMRPQLMIYYTVE